MSSGAWRIFPLVGGGEGDEIGVNGGAEAVQGFAVPGRAFESLEFSSCEH